MIADGCYTAILNRIKDSLATLQLEQESGLVDELSPMKLTFHKRAHIKM